jgi:hypothetical protein
MALSIAMLGCSSPAPAADKPADSATTGSNATGDTGTAGSNATGDTAAGDTAKVPAAEAVPAEYQGSWYSKSEILPPEQETEQYSLNIEADGSFSLLDGEAELYKGTIKITDKPEAGWGEVSIDGKTVAIQLVNAQGVYKFIFNAGDDWNKDLKKIVFQR